jgi:ribonuclease D
MQELHIDTPSGLEELCRQLEGSRWLALDTEFVREKSYYPKFCLLQISNGEVAASVDPLAITDLTPLLELLYAPSSIKIFHSGRQDLEIFNHLWGKLPQPLFDTQLAATMLGIGEQIGYANLVQKLLGRELEKGHTRTDWSRRPLDQAQLRYALDDVIYLGEIYLKLHDLLHQQGRDNWLLDDFKQLADPETYRNNPVDMWLRVKGSKYLKGVQLAVLQELAAWRETNAEQADRPRRWIMKDDLLLELARRQPTNLPGLEKIRGMEPNTIKRHGEQLLELIERAKSKPSEQWPQARKQPPKLTPNQEAITDLLMAALRLAAEREGITASALASRKELEQLVSGERKLELLRGWRKALVGDQLLNLLEGRSTLRIDQGLLSIENHK